MNVRIISQENRARIDEAYSRLQPELGAIRPTKLKRPYGATRAAQQVLSALPGLRRLGNDLSNVLPTFDQSLFGKLEDCALVLAAAQARYEAAVPDTSAAQRLLEQALKLRELLLSDVSTLCRRGIVRPSRLSELKRLRGYEAAAHDLGMLSVLLRGLLPTIQGRSAVTIDDLDLAWELSLELMVARKRSEQGPPSIIVQDRLRAFTLLSRTYDTVRRAIGYLRADRGDAEILMPPLGGRRRRRPST